MAIDAKTIFEKEVKPKLGNVQKEEKYLNILLELADNTTANSGKGLKKNQMSDATTHTLNKLRDTKLIKVTLPAGNGKVLTDPINNRRELFKKSEMIQDYVERFRKHFQEECMISQIIRDKLHISSDKEIIEWVNRLDYIEKFKEYNDVIFGLLEMNIDIKSKGYGPLLLRNMAHYYNLSEEGKNIMIGGSK